MSWPETPKMSEATTDNLRRALTLHGQNRKIDRNFAPTKNVTGARTIPLPDVVGQAIAAHMAEFPSGQDGTLFVKSRGRPWAHEHYGHRDFKVAVRRAGLPPSARRTISAMPSCPGASLTARRSRR